MRVVELLAAYQTLSDPEKKKSLLGELHTLKGESRMLGLSTLATLVHGIEDRIFGGEFDFEVLSAATDAICLSLAEDTSAEFSESLLQTASEALGLPQGTEELTSAEAETSARPPRGSSNLPQENGPRGPSGGGPTAAASPNSWVQVDAALVNDLCENFADLATAFSMHVADVAAWGDTPSPQKLREALTALEEMKSQMSGVLQKSLGLRLTSIDPTLSNLASHVRILAHERNKKLEVHVASGGVKIERDLLEFLREPLLHLCTNAVAHGIEEPENRQGKPEKGRIELRAESSGSTVVVRVRDDGRGIDPAKILEKAAQLGINDSAKDPFELMFEPGFSTREIADEVAGRGVGLDVVKRQIEAIGGSIEVVSAPGEGSTFSVHVPAALTQESLVVFQIGEGLYGITAHLVRSVEAVTSNDEHSIRFHDELIPVRSVARLLGQNDEQASRFIVVKLGMHDHALAVSEVLGFFELLRRPTSPALRARTGFVASAQLDDGRLVLVLDQRFLQLKLAEQPSAEPLRRDQPRPNAKKRVLIVDDSVVVRDLMKEILTGADCETATAKDGAHALKVMKEFKPGLILSDIEMPNMDGFQLLQAIRTHSATLPVILVTARSSTSDRQRATALGASAYIAKGEFERERLVQLVTRYYPVQ